MNDLEKIISLASEIEIAEMDADIVCNVEEANYYYKKYLPSLYKEMNKSYDKLLDKLYATQKHSAYRFQLTVIADP
jgi:hypothetical protein